MKRQAMILILLATLPACAKTELPPCKTTDAYWTNCIGVRSERGGAFWEATYTGEFQDNKKHGNRTLELRGLEFTFEDGQNIKGSNKYTGEFRNGIENGPGRITFYDGSSEMSVYMVDGKVRR